MEPAIIAVGSRLVAGGYILKAVSKSHPSC